MDSELEKYFTKNWMINQDQLNKIEHFAQLIFTINQQFNITGFKTMQQICCNLIIGGIVPYQDIMNYFSESVTLLDVGTGAGIPGILLKILFPSSKIFLMDASEKKTNFLKNVIRELNLQKIFVINQRAENFTKQNLNFFDIVTARALAPMWICLTLMFPYVKVGGKIILPKSNHSKNEYDNCKNLIKEKHLILVEIKQTSREFEDKFNYHTYIFEKTTNAKNTRSLTWSKIKKKYQSIVKTSKH